MGFVMIYKATEMVNFAQGDIMMVGTFVALTLTTMAGANFFIAVLCAILIMAVFGFLVDRVVIRKIIGQPQFSIVILTISLGFVFRSGAGMIWGQSPRTMDTPFAGNFELGSLVIGNERIAIVVGTILVSVLLWTFFKYSRWGLAMQAASQNQLAAFYSDTGQIGLFHGLGAGRGHFMYCRCLACAGHFGKHAERVFGNQGLCRRRDWRFRVSARRFAGRADYRFGRAFCGRLFA